MPGELLHRGVFPHHRGLHRPAEAAFEISGHRDHLHRLEAVRSERHGRVDGCRTAADGIGQHFPQPALDLGGVGGSHGTGHGPVPVLPPHGHRLQLVPQEGVQAGSALEFPAGGLRYGPGAHEGHGVRLQPMLPGEFLADRGDDPLMLGGILAAAVLLDDDQAFLAVQVAGARHSAALPQSAVQ